MKRLLLSSLLVFCMVLSSCSNFGSASSEPKLDSSFSASAEITFGSEVCKAQLRRFSPDNWELCATEPFALEGLIVTVKDGETKLSMYGLEGFADFSDKAVSAVKLIADALNAAPNGTVAKNGTDTTVSGDSESSHYTLTLSENGCPLYLNLSGKGIAVKISDFTELPIEEQIAQEQGEQALSETDEFASVE